MKKLFAGLFAASFFLVPALASADTLSDLQTQLQTLLTQVDSVRAQISALQGGQGNSGTASSTPGFILRQPLCLDLSHRLTVGSTDAVTGGDVSKLQQLLAQDSTVYPEGIVSGYFGPATERAVQRFQQIENLVATGTPETTGFGVVGALTNAFLTSHCPSSPPMPGKPFPQPVPISGGGTSTPPVWQNWPATSTAPVALSPRVIVRANGSPNGASITTGSSAYIGWDSVKVSSCSISSSPSSNLSGSVATSAYAQSSGPLTQTTVFTVSCTATDSSTVNGSITVTVGTTASSGITPGTTFKLPPPPGFGGIGTSTVLGFPR